MSDKRKYVMPGTTQEILLHNIDQANQYGFDVGGFSPVIDGSHTITRPADTTAYAVGDQLSDITFTFVDGDVTVASDTITETAHGLSTGDVVGLSTGGALPTGLSASTVYFVIAVDDDTISLATTYANAIDGTAIDITAASGGGTHTVHRGLTFSVGRTNSSTGVCLGGTMISSAYQSTLPAVNLKLFSEAVNITDDNLASAITDAQMLKHLGTVWFKAADGTPGNPTSGAGGNVSIEGSTIRPITLNCESDRQVVYGIPIFNNAYTPVSGETFTFRLGVERNALTH